MQSGDLGWFSGKVILSSQLNLVRSHQIQMGSVFYSSRFFFPNIKKKKKDKRFTCVNAQSHKNKWSWQPKPNTIDHTANVLLPSPHRILEVSHSTQVLVFVLLQNVPRKAFYFLACDNQKDTRVVFKNPLNHLIVHDSQSCFLQTFPQPPL